MSYFEGVKIGDRVWDFVYGWGTVKIVNKPYGFVVKFNNSVLDEAYTFDGKIIGGNNQTLFWDEIKFEIPKKPKIELKEFNYEILFNKDKIVIYKPDDHYDNLCKYSKQNGLTRNDKETAEKALKDIKRFARLLALRDQECPDSRGYEFDDDKNNYIITKDINKYLTLCVYDYQPECVYDYQPDKIYFKTREDAQKICDILNSNRFDLEGE